MHSLSQLHYGLLVWINIYVSYLTPIKILYKRCVRLLSYEHSYAHPPPLALHLGFLIFDDFFTYLSAIFMFEIANKLPSCISCLVQCLHGSTHINTTDYFLPRARLKICETLIILLGFKFDCGCIVTLNVIIILELLKGPVIHTYLINI